MSVDVVIVGGGAAGCVLAARLTEDPAVQVLLLEAGPDYTSLPPDLDDGWGRPAVGNHDWGFTAVSDPVTTRTLDVSRGKVIGGSSTTNAAFALRGHPDDYDAWAAMGHAGWGWNDVLPDFVRLERDLDFGDRPYHGTDGPIPIHRYRGAERSRLAAAAHDAIAASGVPATDDHNAPGAVGVGPLPVNELDRRRMGAASTYLAYARCRPNLTVRGDTLVDSVVVSEGRATGVRTAAGETITAGRVIVAAGAYVSPAVLLRSGIGPAAELERLGIAAVVDNDAVGAGLQDHPAVSIDMAYAGPVEPCRLMQTIATLRCVGTASTAPPDLHVFAMGPFPTPDMTLWFLGIALVKPRSRGRVSLQSADPADPPRIELGYYTDSDDLLRHVEGLRRGLDIVKAPELTALTSKALNVPAGTDDDALGNHIRSSAWSYHHPVGTCAMGAVVDANGRVHGVEGLSVIDASIMPAIPSVNTHLPTLMIAEHLAPACVS